MLCSRKQNTCSTGPPPTQFASVLCAQNQFAPSEVVQWSNHRVMEWLRSVDLAEYAPNLRGSGVHGGLIVSTHFHSEWNLSRINTQTHTLTYFTGILCAFFGKDPLLRFRSVEALHEHLQGVWGKCSDIVSLPPPVNSRKEKKRIEKNLVDLFLRKFLRR